MLRSINIVKKFSPYLQVLLIAAVLAVVLKVYVVDAIVVPSASMERTLLVGDFVLVNKLVHGSPSAQNEAGLMPIPPLRRVEPGDVIVFRFPSPENTVFVKRCVGGSGDEIEIQNGVLFVNGVRSALPPGSSAESFGPVVVPKAGQHIGISASNERQWEKFIEQEGHTIECSSGNNIIIDGRPANLYTVTKNYLFVLGDNRGHSFDSRSWGFLPEENVIGKATCIYWSMDQAGDVRWNRIGTFVH